MIRATRATEFSYSTIKVRQFVKLNFNKDGDAVSQFFYVFLLVVTFPLADAYGQACCSAGTPLLGSLDIGATPEKSIHFALTYDHNLLKDVLSGQQIIEGNRQRLSQSLLLESAYGIDDRWSISAIFSFIQQQRRLNTENSFNSREELTTRGLGDAVIMIKYNLQPLNLLRQRQIAIGLGVKMPTGRSDLRLNGILLPADMQPGSGAWDGIAWAYFYQGFLPVTRFNFFMNSSYRFTGTNNRFRLQDGPFKGYQFGNEWLTTGGISYRTDRFLDYTILLRYRHLKADQFAGAKVANTGGHWLYVLPGINWNRGDFSLRLTGQIPVYRRLVGVQLTTSYSASLSLFYTLSLKQNP